MLAILLPTWGAFSAPAGAYINASPAMTFTQQPLSPQSPNAVQYYDGAIQYSTITNCVSIIQYAPYLEYGLGAYVGFAADPVAALPGPSQVYYLHVVVAGLGNACSGQRAWIELALPANTGLAISAGNPVKCFFDGVPDQPECPQSLPGSSLHPGAYWIPSVDTAHARTWPMPQGHFLEIQVPVISSTTLTNSSMVAYVKALDGESNPWLQPSEGVYVFSNTPTVIYPSPSTEYFATAPHYKSSAYVYSHYIAGDAYFDLGTDGITYNLFHDGPVTIPIPNQPIYPAYTVWSDWTPYSLLPATTYHWRVRFVTAGGTYYGPDQTFTTPPDGLATVGSGAAAGCTTGALDTALATPGLKQIVFNCGSVPVTITLSGSKTISTSLSIDGGNKVTLQGNNTFRLFDVTGGTLTLNKISLTGGSVTGCGGAIHVANAAGLSTNYARITASHATGNGGGLCIDSGGGVLLSNTQVTGNSASADGGGIWNAGSVDAMWSDLSGNTAGGQGGGAFNSGALYFSVSLISGNNAPTGQIRSGTPTIGGGGGIFNAGTLDLYTSTVAANTASFAGGVFNNSGTITASNATIAGNTALAGGKLLFANAQAGGLESGTGSATLRNSIVANNLVPGLLGGMVQGNCSTSPTKTIISQGNNLEFGAQCGFIQASDHQNTDPLLGPLANNGGRTRTMALFPKSPAIDHADNFYCGMFDQRGFSGPTPPASALQRQVDGDGDGQAICDIGAYEYHPTLFIPFTHQ